ncbi:MAG: thioredoxin family protein [Arenicella sp.]|nr:thioredoxin family protein [Arenicella sp.]
MVATESLMQTLGTSVPQFSLPDVTQIDAKASLPDYQGKPLLIMFICNHCPFVIHIISQLSSIANEYHDKGFGVVAISSNDVETYPQDGPVPMRKFAAQYGFSFPYCYDSSQQVAKNFGAACTPDFFVYDADHELVYRGQFDASRPGNNELVTGIDLRSALQAVLDGAAPLQNQLPSIGCNIKWLAGNEPDYS